MVKKWFWSAGGYYGIWSLTFFIGYLWISSRYNLFAGTAASPEGRELLWYWVSGFGLLFILPLGIGQVAAGILSYRYAASRPRTWVSLLLGLVLCIPAVVGCLFGYALFILLFHGFA